MDLTKPDALRVGDTIGVVAPAGPVNRERIERAFRRLEQQGFRLKTYGDIHRANGYLAGDDAARAAELNEAFRDSQTNAVWCARGGYGAARILDRIDYQAIRHNPKVFIGFSDITVLHIAFQQHAHLVTFHGPNLQDGFGSQREPSIENMHALWQAVCADRSEPATGERAGYDFDFGAMTDVSLRPISPGIARARLTGGNLAVLCGLMGTPYEIDTTGKILFLEDVSERLYRIDRYLAQLRLSGKLHAAAGVLLGSFSYDEGETPESESDVTALFDEYLRDLPVPVLAGFPSGHAKRNMTLPFGARIQLDADHRRVSVLESPVAKP